MKKATEMDERSLEDNALEVSKHHTQEQEQPSSEPRDDATARYQKKTTKVMEVFLEGEQLNLVE
jgi:hypothetical protein